MITELTKNEISINIENSLIDYLHIVSKKGNRPFFLDEKIGWVKTFPTSWSNFIFYSNFDDNQIAHEITRVINGIKSGEFPDEWLIGPKSRPINLSQYLESNNFQKKYDMAGMAIDLEKLKTDVSLPKGIIIKTVDNVPMIKLWADTVSKGLWNEDIFESCLFEELICDPKFKFYLAFFDEEPIATSMLLLSNKAASINMISTLKKYRGKGIGTAMTLAPLLHARNIGYKIGILQASKSGEPIYRKIGFEEYCRFNVYKYQAIN